MPDDLRLLLADAQTSGGLLLCVAEDATDAAVANLAAADVSAAVIGEITAGRAGTVAVS